MTGEIIAQKISEMKPLRDIYIDYLEILLSSDRDWSNIIRISLESIYNAVFRQDVNVHSNDHVSFFFWNLFICITAVLYHFEYYNIIHEIVTRTYFLSNGNRVEPCNYTFFRNYYDSLEGSYKENSPTPNLTSMTSEILISQVKYPYLTCDSITFSDILLCQLSFALDIRNDDTRWFADSYIYNHSAHNEWVKMKSMRYCKSILSLYGADSIETLKTILFSNPVNVGEYSHERNGRRFPALTAMFKENEIASLP